MLSILLVSHVSAQNDSSIEGRVYKGAGEAEFQEGCEGCGNPGHVEFETDNMVSFTLPGADIIEGGNYTREGNMITFPGISQAMELKGDTLFFHAYDYVHTYLRVRK